MLCKKHTLASRDYCWKCKQAELEAAIAEMKEAALAVVESMNVREYPSGKHYDVETCDPAKMNALAALIKEKE